MTRLTGRRDILVAGTVALAMTTGTVTAQSPDDRAIVEYEGGQPIPKGQLQVYVEDPGVAGKRAAPAEVATDGKTKEIEFTLGAASGARSAGPVQVVAQLQRADGWLLARGSADYAPGTPMRITLFAAMY